ncbi:MAG: hypothetical protein RL385_771, partial [Pseudomonadota bacterium]
MLQVDPQDATTLDYRIVAGDGLASTQSSVWFEDSDSRLNLTIHVSSGSENITWTWAAMLDATQVPISTDRHQTADIALSPVTPKEYHATVDLADASTGAHTLAIFPIESPTGNAGHGV